MNLSQKGNVVIAGLLIATVASFFGIGQISQYKDNVNTLSENVSVLQNYLVEQEAEIIDLQNQLDAQTEDVEQKLGAFRPSGYTGKLLTRLSEGGSETTFRTTPNEAPDGTGLSTAKLGDFIVLTINPGADNEEKISVSAVATSSGGVATWTIIDRGLSFTQNVSLADNKKQHAIGETVIISDDDHFLSEQYPSKDSDEVVTGMWSFPAPTTGSNPATRDYVLSTISGTSSINFDELTLPGTAGETFATGTVVFLQENDQEWYRLDVDIDSHYIDREIGIANGPGTNGVNISGGVTVRGLVTSSGLTAGANYFASSVAGGTTTATTSQPLGVARSTTQLYFNPSLIKSTVYTPTTFSATTTFSGWVDGIASTTVRYYTTTGASTWTKPANLKYITVETIGGGAGGGTEADQFDAGGGAGGYCRVQLSASELSSTSTVVVRVGNGGAAEASGESSSFGTFCTSNGGVAGVNDTPGDGGSASGGDLNLQGGGGTDGGENSGGSPDICGSGGNSFFGGGGRGHGGGANGASNTGGGAGCGGTGGSGIVMVTEHF